MFFVGYKIALRQKNIFLKINFSEKQDCRNTISGLKFCFLLWSNVGAVKRDVRVGICAACKMYSVCVECVAAGCSFTSSSHTVLSVEI